MSSNYDFLYYLHVAIILFVIGIPFLPRNILRYAVYVPAIIAIGWVIFDGCVITQNQAGMVGDSFIHTLLMKWFPAITLRRSEQLTTLMVVLSTLFGAKRLWS
jgi:hypothetical protein